MPLPYSNRTFLEAFHCAERDTRSQREAFPVRKSNRFERCESCMQAVQRSEIHLVWSEDRPAPGSIAEMWWSIAEIQGALRGWLCLKVAEGWQRLRPSKPARTLCDYSPRHHVGHCPHLPIRRRVQSRHQSHSGTTDPLWFCFFCVATLSSRIVFSGIWVTARHLLSLHNA